MKKGKTNAKQVRTKRKKIVRKVARKPATRIRKDGRTGKKIRPKPIKTIRRKKTSNREQKLLKQIALLKKQLAQAKKRKKPAPKPTRKPKPKPAPQKTKAPVKKTRQKKVVKRHIKPDILDDFPELDAMDDMEALMESESEWYHDQGV